MASSGQQKEVVKLRFSKAKASVLALSLSLAVSGSVFAATSGEEEDSIGWSELQEDASNYDWTISDDKLATGNLKDNVFEEVIKKNDFDNKMSARGLSAHLPYIVETSGISGGSGYPGGYCVFGTGEIDFLNLVHLEKKDYVPEAEKRDNRAQNIYNNSLIAGSFVLKTSLAYADEWRELWDRNENIQSGAASMEGDQQAIAILAGEIIGNNIDAYYATKGDTNGIEFLDNTPYLSSGGILGIFRRSYYRSSGATDELNTNGSKSRFFKVEEKIKKNAGGKTEIKSLESPMLFLNGSRNVPYSSPSDVRRDVDNYERVLYVHGQIAQAMHDGTWKRSNAVLKRESELFSEDLDDNMLYLCLPMKQSKLKNTSWEKWMIVDKFYIPKQYQYDEDNAPSEVEEELEKMNSLLDSMPLS